MQGHRGNALRMHKIRKDDKMNMDNFVWDLDNGRLAITRDNPLKALAEMEKNIALYKERGHKVGKKTFVLRAGRIDKETGFFIHEFGEPMFEGTIKQLTKILNAYVVETNRLRD